MEDIEKKREMIKLKRLEDAANKTEGEKQNDDHANQEVQEIPDEKSFQRENLFLLLFTRDDRCSREKSVMTDFFCSTSSVHVY